MARSGSAGRAGSVFRAVFGTVLRTGAGAGSEVTPCMPVPALLGAAGLRRMTMPAISPIARIAARVTVCFMP